ncbi:hypothetical protein LOS78_12805 [Paracoccus sp. MA]|uniref:hypothetical protein n=1 Tax=Paracoccus sp. MA TaxID=2895796 RepID=UPI001E393985|nr:hypothetical protein [Paracoccus sp. MA]UFM66806.1 hypothetical protein LOS78_12805 [Paracoccus sp. MA]
MSTDEKKILARAAREKIVIKGGLGSESREKRREMTINALGSAMQRLEIERIKQVRRRLSGVKIAPDPVRQSGSVRYSAESQAPKIASTVPEYVPKRAVPTQTIRALEAAGVQRSTVELNSMRPLQVLADGGTWSLMQHPVALIPASAFVDPGDGGASGASISIMPMPSPDVSLRDHVDELCASTLPPDGAIHLSGRLIVEAPTDMDVGVDISIPGPLITTGWSGWPYVDANMSAGSGKWSTAIEDHEMLGRQISHDVTNIEMRRPWIHSLGVSRARKVAVYEIAMWRAAAGGTTFADIIRKI